MEPADNLEDTDMTDKEKLLIMTICNLLGKQVYPNQIDTAYEQQESVLEHSKEPSVYEGRDPIMFFVG